MKNMLHNHSSCKSHKHLKFKQEKAHEHFEGHNMNNTAGSVVNVVSGLHAARSKTLRAEV